MHRKAVGSLLVFLGVLVGSRALEGCVGNDASVTPPGTDDGGGGGGSDAAPIACAEGKNACGGRCVEPNDVTACGASCTPCVVPANGTVSCDGTCKPACNEGFSVCGDACRDLKSDANHCGHCGRVCGTTCGESRCATTKIADVTDGVDLVVGAANVFVRTTTSVLQIPKAAGTATPFFVDSGWNFGAGPAIDSLDVYFFGMDPGANSGIFKRAIVGTLPPVRIAPATTSCTTNCGMKVFGGTYLWYDAYAMHGCNGACATNAFDIDVGGQLVSAALSATHVVWTNYTGIGSVFRCVLPDCAPPTRETLYEVDTNTSPGLVAVHKDIAYWLDNATGHPDKARVLACPIAGCGGVPKVLVKGENEMTGLAVDDSGVFFSVGGDTANLAGVVKVCRDLVNGCGVGSEILADKQAQTGAVALDATHVYWINKGVDSGPPGTVPGSVARVAK